MVKRTVILLLTLIIAAAAVYFCFFRDTPEEKVRRVLSELCESLSKPEGEKLAATLMKNKSLEKIFAEPVSVQIQQAMFNGEYTIAGLQASAARIHMMFSDLKISADDVTVELTSPESASVFFSGRLQGITKNRTKVDEVRDLLCTLKLIDDDWKISAVQIQEVLAK